MSLLSLEVATDLAARALRNIAREYPNHPQYLLDSEADLELPRTVHPVFFGCFDWHSAVHTHWLLLRLWRQPELAALRGAVERALDDAFETDKLLVEARYLERRPAFERPYGLAWLAFLVAEAATTRWQAALAPLAAACRANVLRWLGGLRYAVRSGTHNQTAFALTLLQDAAVTLGDAELGAAVRRRTLDLYLADEAVSLAFEPSGEDFLSPALMEADLMRRALPEDEFTTWLARFLPNLPRRPSSSWLPCGEVTDETDGKGVHLHGLNLSRAWNLRNLAAALPDEDQRVAVLREAAERHADAGIRSTLACRHYAGDHWLPSFAVYLLTEPARRA